MSHLSKALHASRISRFPERNGKQSRTSLVMCLIWLAHSFKTLSNFQKDKAEVYLNKKHYNIF